MARAGRSLPAAEGVECPSCDFIFHRRCGTTENICPHCRCDMTEVQLYRTAPRAAKAQTANRMTRMNTPVGYSDGDVIEARDLRAKLLKTSRTGIVKTYRVSETHNGYGAMTQLQKVRTVIGGWKAYKHESK